MRTVMFLIALLAAIVLTSRPSAQPEAEGLSRAQSRETPADLLIVGGRVYSGAGTFHEALAIGGNRIVAVGRTADLERWKGPHTEVIDARGRAIVAGFNDSHVHFVNGGLALQELDLSGVTTLREVQARITAFAQRKPDASWVRGRGWLYSPFPGGLPTRQQLDEVVRDRPAIMVCYDGHSVWVNSKALTLAGITKDTPDPKNGVIVKDPNTGEPTGVLKEAAMALVSKVLPPATPDDRLLGLPSPKRIAWA
jgi:predicted amidohydrolase YtcJ